MKCLLFGGSGFVGRQLHSALHNGGYEVCIASRTSRRPIPGRESVYKTCDVRNATDVRKLIATFSPSLVINLATQVAGVADDLCETNIAGSLNILEACRDHHSAKWLISFGSAAEYGHLDPSALPILETSDCHPVNLYGATKLAATTALLSLASSWAVRVTILRPFNLLGADAPSTQLIGALLDRIVSATVVDGVREISVGRIDTARDFIDVNDLVEAVLAVIRSRPETGIINICSGVPTRVEDLLTLLREVTGTNLVWRSDQSLFRASDPLVSYGSNKKLLDLTGVKPRIPLDVSLSDSWRSRKNLLEIQPNGRV